MAPPLLSQEAHSSNRQAYGDQPARSSRIRTFIKKVDSAVAEGDLAAARDAFGHAEPRSSRCR